MLPSSNFSELLLHINTACTQCHEFQTSANSPNPTTQLCCIVESLDAQENAMSPSILPLTISSREPIPHNDHNISTHTLQYTWFSTTRPVHPTNQDKVLKT
jgi:hypothetical protein